MGCFDIYCGLCGFPSTEPAVETPGSIKGVDWMTKVYFMTYSGKLIKDCENDSCGNVFVSKKYNNIRFEAEPIVSPENYNRGIFVHKDCWEFAKACGHELNASMFPIDTKDMAFGVKAPLVHKKFDKYRSQYFDFEGFIADGNQKLLTSPKTNKNLQAMIKKSLASFKLKNDRLGPSISASFEKANAYRMGNDGYIWQKVDGKWKKVNEKVNYSKPFSTKKIGNYDMTPQIYEANDKKPLFVHIDLDKRTFTLVSTVYHLVHPCLD